jgi:hypothetical protein
MARDPDDLLDISPEPKPTVVTDEILEEMCARLTDGQSLRRICNDAHMPTRQQVFRLLGRPGPENQPLRDHYARATTASATAFADTIVYYNEEVAAKRMDPAAARVAIDALKWTAGKQQPKKYGDATQMKISGAVGTFDPTKMATDDLTKLLAIVDGSSSSGGDGPDGEGGTGEAEG